MEEKNQGPKRFEHLDTKKLEGILTDKPLAPVTQIDYFREETDEKSESPNSYFY